MAPLECSTVQRAVSTETEQIPASTTRSPSQMSLEIDMQDSYQDENNS
jgi:hypothetical protein